MFSSLASITRSEPELQRPVPMYRHVNLQGHLGKINKSPQVDHGVQTLSFFLVGKSLAVFMMLSSPSVAAWPAQHSQPEATAPLG
jgi:hypothetical protein